uniref:VWFA domain-containing protein n=1 Tax=Eptatretus burgeri TaxID=7764 RepID=A0A8C4R362_EPTBU
MQPSLIVPLMYCFTDCTLNQSNPCSPAEEMCREVVVDIVFVLDGSRSVLVHNFEKVKDFVNVLIRGFHVGPNMTHVGVVQYSSRVQNEVVLGTLHSKEALRDAVQSIKHLSEGTVTGAAIRFMTNVAFRNARPGVPRLALVLTDGRSADDVTAPAKAAHGQGITMFAIGVTDNVDEDELKIIATDPDSIHLYHVDDFDLLQKLQLQQINNKLMILNLKIYILYILLSLAICGFAIRGPRVFIAGV